jgi:hypothetical protein
MKKIIYTSVSLIVLIGIVAFKAAKSSSEIKEALNGISSFYSGHNHVYQELEYRFYTSHKESQSHSAESGVLVYAQDAQYSNYSVGVDCEDNTLLLSNHLTIPSRNPAEQIQGLNHEDLSLVESNGTTNILIYKQNSGEIEEMAFYYDKSTFELSKIVMNYRKEIQVEDAEDADWVQPKMEIIYSNTDLNGKGKELLQLNYFVQKTGDHWKPSDKYSEYQFINNIKDFSAFK